MKELVLSLLLVLGISAAVLAQTGSGGITGSVVDDNGAPIPGVTITLSRAMSDFERVIATNDAGGYSFTALPPGSYSIKAEATGFATAQKENLVLEAGVTIGVNFILRPSDLTSEVTVTAEPATAVVSVVTEGRVISELPGASRNPFQLLLTLPGTSQANPPADSAVNGISKSAMNFTIDGTNVNNFRTGGASTTIATEAVSSFRVVVSNFSADTGRPSGGLLGMASRMGTNEFHGSAFFQFRDDSLQASSPFVEARKPAYGNDFFGASIGGPIKKNVAFFFVAFERDRNEEVTTVGTRDTVRRRIVPSYAGLPFYSTKATGRLDLNASTNDVVTARYSVTDQHGIAAGLSQGARLQAESNFHSQTGAQHQFTSSWQHNFKQMTNETLVSFVTQNDQVKPVTTSPQIVFPSLNVGANFAADQSTVQRRLQVKDDATLAYGDHTFKFGVDYSHLSLPEPNNFNLFGQGIIFVPCDFPGERGCPLATTDADIPVQFALINRQNLIQPAPFGSRGVIPQVRDGVFAVYGQDDFRVSQKLTLSFGLRWDYDRDFFGRNQFNLVSRGRRKAHKRNYQPRIGLAWLLRKFILIRGGYGTHFQPSYLQVRQLELLANSLNLPLVRSFGGTLGNPFGGLNSATPPDIFVTSDELKEKFTQTFSASTEIEIKDDTVLSATVVITRDRHAPVRVEINRQPNGTRLFSQFGSVLETQSIGKSSYDGLTISLKRRYGLGFSFLRNYYFDAAYTLSKTNNQTNDLLSFLTNVSSPANPRLDYGPSSFDARHRFSFSGVFELRKGFTVSPTIQAHSSLPFEIIQNHDFSEGAASGFYRLPVVARNAGNRQIRTGADANQAIDAFNANPALVLAHGGPIAHVDPTVNLGHAYFTMSLRVTKRFLIRERKGLDIGASVFNLTNRTNVIGRSGSNSAGVQNNVESPGFGRPLGITAGSGVFDPGAARGVELVAKFWF